MNIDNLTEKIQQIIDKKGRAVIAIDGGAGTGKTTLAKQISDRFDANVFHTDDYFLTPSQRCEQRLVEIGGNIDYERFYKEVICGIKRALPFSYTPFSCKTMSFGEKIAVNPRKLEIVEGSYSQRPEFCEIYDLKIFLVCDFAIRKQRIVERAPERAERFFSEWIPKEDAYFEKFKIRESADVVLIDK